MELSRVDERISHIRADAEDFEAAYPIYQRAIENLPTAVSAGYAVELFQSIDYALGRGVTGEYLYSLLGLVEGWNDTCLILEVAPTAYDRGMDPSYVSSVYLLDYAFDDWKTLSERLAELHDAGVPAQYAVSVASGELYVGDITAAWKTGIAAEYVASVRG